MAEHLTPLGWLFIICGWGFIIWLASFCFYRTFKSGSPKEPTPPPPQPAKAVPKQ